MPNAVKAKHGNRNHEGKNRATFDSHMVGKPEVVRFGHQEISSGKRATGLCQTGCKGTEGER